MSIPYLISFLVGWKKPTDEIKMKNNAQHHVRLPGFSFFLFFQISWCFVVFHPIYVEIIVFFESDSHFYVIIIYKSDLYDINVTWIFLNYNYSIIARCWFFVYDLLRAFNRSFLIIKDRINNAIRVCLITNWNGGVFKEIRSLRLNLEINKLLRKIYEKVKIFGWS